MGTTPDAFVRRLRSGKRVSRTYRAGELTGLIEAWPHDGRFVLTWEECRDGDQYDEHAYTRDERHQFDTADEVLDFVVRSGHPASGFGW